MQFDDQTVFCDYEISNLLLKSIDDAKNEVTIVCPYLKFWPNLTEVIERARLRGVKFRLFFREDEKNELAQAEFRTLFHVCVAVPVLHAKLYFFDDEIIMSSMSLHEYSYQSNKEIAVRLVDSRQKEEVRKYLREQLLPKKGRNGTLVQ
jgi:phosphatidylserine/phosphatidylglycerophosphate/cardiolipin synthase-like enzyme